MPKRKLAQALSTPFPHEQRDPEAKSAHPELFPVASKNAAPVKTADVLIREAYTRTENLLQLNERKIQEGFRLNDEGLESFDLPARDFRIVIQNIQDLQADLQRFSDAVHGRNATENPLASRTNPLLELILDDLGRRFQQAD
jgi:hypothetical protein